MPQFPMNPDWLEEGLSYPVANDFARYLCKEAALQDYAEVEQGLRFLEESVKRSDVLDLVDECLETLLSCLEITELKKHFGPALLDRWNTTLESRYLEKVKWGHLR